MSFKKAQAKIQKESGVSEKAAAAILAAGARNASAKAVTNNPNLKKVKGVANMKSNSKDFKPIDDTDAKFVQFRDELYQDNEYSFIVLEKK